MDALQIAAMMVGTCGVIAGTINRKNFRRK
jgi:hypothetical protein